MSRLRLILGALVAAVLVIGSAVIVYTGRPVMHEPVAGTNAAPADGIVPPLPTVAANPGDGGAANGGGQPPSTTPAPAPAPAPAPPPGTYSMADVRRHASQSDCWSAIDGGVYDLTSWIDRHPGGPDFIIMLCGTDGSDAYNGQHGGQGRPAYYLALLKIGTLR